MGSVISFKKKRNNWRRGKWRRIKWKEIIWNLLHLWLFFPSKNNAKKSQNISAFPQFANFNPYTCSLHIHGSVVATIVRMAWQTPWKVISSDAVAKSDRDDKSEVLVSAILFYLSLKITHYKLLFILDLYNIVLIV